MSINCVWWSGSLLFLPNFCRTCTSMARASALEFFVYRLGAPSPNVQKHVSSAELRFHKHGNCWHVGHVQGESEMLPGVVVCTDRLFGSFVQSEKKDEDADDAFVEFPVSKASREAITRTGWAMDPFTRLGDGTHLFSLTFPSMHFPEALTNVQQDPTSGFYVADVIQWSGLWQEDGSVFLRTRTPEEDSEDSEDPEHSGDRHFQFVCSVLRTCMRSSCPAAVVAAAITLDHFTEGDLRLVSEIPRSVRPFVASCLVAHDSIVKDEKTRLLVTRVLAMLGCLSPLYFP